MLYVGSLLAAVTWPSVITQLDTVVSTEFSHFCDPAIVFKLLFQFSLIFPILPLKKISLDIVKDVCSL